MKLKVASCEKKAVWFEADTIASLKALIMDEFSLSADDLNQRLLVRDHRDHAVNMNPITGCVDLLHLADGSILDELNICKDGDIFFLGWKGYCIVRLVTNFFAEEGHNIKVDNSFTLGEFKKKIERLTGEPVTENNLPSVLVNGDEDKPLLFFGYYRFWKARGDDSEIEIHPTKNNMPVSKYPIVSLVKTDANGNKFLFPLMNFCELGSESESEPEYYEKEKMKRKTESTENIESQKKKKKKKNKA